MKERDRWVGRQVGRQVGEWTHRFLKKDDKITVNGEQERK